MSTLWEVTRLTLGSHVQMASSSMRRQGRQMQHVRQTSATRYAFYMSKAIALQVTWARQHMLTAMQHGRQTSATRYVFFSCVITHSQQKHMQHVRQTSATRYEYLSITNSSHTCWTHAHIKRNLATIKQCKQESNIEDRFVPSDVSSYVNSISFQ